MLSSANYVREAGVLQSGNTFASEVSPEILQDPNTVIFEHQVKGAKFYMPDGAELVFQGGVFITRNKDILGELNKVANKQGTLITTNKAALDRMRAEIKVAVEDAARPASEGNVVGMQTIELATPTKPQAAI